MTSKIAGGRYVLAVKNLGNSIAFYIDSLGFTLLWQEDGWGFVVRDTCQIMLGECPEDVEAFETGSHSYFAYLETENIESLYEELANKNLKILGPMEDKPWRMREFGIETIDGHRMMFGMEI
jgi:Glyoxalase/Bleomycin resistance protein/Dioxygenase superfamily